MDRADPDIEPAPLAPGAPADLIGEIGACHRDLREATDAVVSARADIEPLAETLRQLNDEMAERTSQLDDTHDVFDAVLEAVGEAVVVIGADQRIRGWSAGASASTGLSAASARGRALRDVGRAGSLGRACQEAWRGLAVASGAAPEARTLRLRADGLGEGRAVGLGERGSGRLRAVVVRFPAVGSAGAHAGSEPGEDPAQPA